MTVSGMYRLKRDEEENNFESCGVKHNRELLWHGTDTSHVISILKNGIKQDEIHAIKTGNSLGSVSNNFISRVERKTCVYHFLHISFMPTKHQSTEFMVNIKLFCMFRKSQFSGGWLYVY